MSELAQRLVNTGLSLETARRLAGIAEGSGSDVERWRRAIPELAPDFPFPAHLLLFSEIYSHRGPDDPPAPCWLPGDDEVRCSNLARLIADRGLADYDELYRWSVVDRVGFWEEMVTRLGIVFRKQPDCILGRSERWLPGSRLNIAESCFSEKSTAPAVIHQAEGGPIQKTSLTELRALANRVAHGLRDLGFEAGDAIAIDMPMTLESVAAYLGIVLAGCVVISIADSFAADEIATRLQIGRARGVICQDVISRAGKTLPLFDKIAAAQAPCAIVIPARDTLACTLRPGDVEWSAFLSDHTDFDAVACEPDATTNILFSSGTTGDPKAIPWGHTTPIKCAADGFLHHDIRPGDVVAWPTNLGWMMGPWLIYASLTNRASVALFYGTPTGRGFGSFVAEAGVTMLGVVPSLVNAWRSSGCLSGLDWSKIRCFSSTGECSNREDMLYLMSRAGYRPVIEYCGGTEIGGGYITGSVLQPAAPATFSTPSLGLELVIAGEDGGNCGELFLIPPSVGLSTRLLNRDHREVYFSGTPKGPDGQLFRRHGDCMQRLPGGYFRAMGRVDDTMNLGGIKISSAEIERTVNALSEVEETAAVAVPPPGGGPSRLVIFTVLRPDEGAAADDLRARMQALIRSHLNPLFKIWAVRICEALPRTASNKVMRRALRARVENGA